ncbi:hypothetical protein NCCP1664_20830 [Zafaria cholistanensis]|uniref:Uncharacterized protein n=1 Tax=Zafaria cholistanensis TaxID=1682741 RepID=A0A5A7NUP5_9MICC|nr:hypothetical protein [Zafaria cholistanensis]GER23588.1 hypothetical protein NCCP1664_20830 [Zafaria cholistanensis]
MSIPLRITLTMAQRLAVMSPADNMLRDPAPLPQAVVPLASWLTDAVTPDQRWAKLLIAQPMAERVELQLGGKRTVSAAAIPGLNPAAARKLAQVIGAEWVWLQSKAGRTDACFSGSRSRFTLGRADVLAAQHGGTLEKTLRNRGFDFAIPQWTNVDRPGWHLSNLGATCHCGRNLVLVDWWHAEAPRRANSHFVACSAHGIVGAVEGAPWRNLVQLRRELDAALAVQGPAARRYSVYVVEVLGLPRSSKRPVYVGMTSKPIPVRLEEHAIEGHPLQGRVFRKAKGGRVGQLLAEETKSLPELRSQLAARTAEAWVAEVLRLRGFDVHGGH